MTTRVTAHAAFDLSPKQVRKRAKNRQASLISDYVKHRVEQRDSPDTPRLAGATRAALYKAVLMQIRN
jgi:hypothetical protein